MTSNNGDGVSSDRFRVDPQALRRAGEQFAAAAAAVPDAPEPYVPQGSDSLSRVLAAGAMQLGTQLDGLAALKADLSDYAAKTIRAAEMYAAAERPADVDSRVKRLIDGDGSTV